MTVPAWVDKARLCAEICACDATIDTWVKRGIIPPPRKRGGKLLWKWTEVDAYLDHGAPDVALSPETDVERIRDATRRAAAESR